MSNSPDMTGWKVLVTGASGMLGSRTVAILSERGCTVRALVRKTSRTDHLRLPNVTIFYGDVVEASSMSAAFDGVDYVIHAAADTSGSEEKGKRITVQGTRNILNLCRTFKVKKLVYISSCNVYGVTDYQLNQLVNEDSPLERFPEKRGAYSASKLAAEEHVIREMKAGSYPIVILRPGTIYGPGGELFTPMLGFSLFHKIFIVIGNGKFELPLIYIDNLVDVVVKTISSSEANNQMLNAVDSERMNKKQYVGKLIKTLYPRSWVFYLPYSMMYALTWSQEMLFKALRRNPFLTRYRLISSQRNITYDNAKITRTLQWQPKISVDEAIAAIIQYERRGNNQAR